MAPKWPQVNNGPEHINEHAAYLREACNQLQAVDRGRQNQVPWNIVQAYIDSTIALASKVLRQPALSEVLHHIKDAAQCTQNIQRDVLVIKNSVGLSTASLHATNPRGSRAAAATWAQVAAQAKGPPIVPPPAPQNTRTDKAEPTVTAYKDRAVTVKLKDHGIAQRFRTFSAAKVRQQVETSIREHAATKSVKVVAAHQLKSGDIQIFTSSTAEATKLKEKTGWIRGLGEHAELIVPTYGVIVHGISTNSINLKDQKATIQQLLADNYTVIPKAEISFVGWLTKESPLKRASSIVVEFKDPEMANAIIYTGMAWDGQIHTCQLYDRACRVKQCFRCYNYGHIGAQCNAAQTCGYCAGLHETKNCTQKGEQGFTPRCAVCKGTHTAWSNACPARKKELGRVEQAKQVRDVYWPVISKKEPPKDDNPEARPRQTRNPETNRTSRATAVPAADSTGSTVTIPESPMEQPTDAPQEPRAPLQTALAPTPADLSVAEDWATPATQQEIIQQLSAVDPRLLETQQSLSIDQAAYGTSRLETTEPAPRNAVPAQPSPYPLDGMDGEFDLDDADAWLANLADNYAGEQMHDVVETTKSPATSLATDTRTAQGNIYKGCKCPEHQELYSNWPTSDAELTIAQCMRICMYCGKDFPVAAELRKHIRKRVQYAQRNLTVYAETRGKGSSSTPG